MSGDTPECHPSRSNVAFGLRSLVLPDMPGAIYYIAAKLLNAFYGGTVISHDLNYKKVFYWVIACILSTNDAIPLNIHKAVKKVRELFSNLKCVHY